MAKKRAKKRSKAENDFIKGRTNTVTLSPTAIGKPSLGFSPTLATASGAGAHGGNARQQNKRSRKAARDKLRSGEWD